MWATRCEISLHRLFTLSFGRLASIFNLSQTAYWKVTCRKRTDTHQNTYTHAKQLSPTHLIGLLVLAQLLPQVGIVRVVGLLLEHRGGERGMGPGT